MARVKLVFKPDDHPAANDAETDKDLATLFDYMFPHVEHPEIRGSSGGFAVVAQNPRLALLIFKLVRYIADEMPWCQQRDLRELAIQTLNLHFKCDIAFQAHLSHAQEAGVGIILQAAIPYWRTSNIFNDEQKLVIEYTFAVVRGEVPEELFARVVEKYGQKGAIEFTTAVGWWSFWAMLLNATRPEFDFGYGKPRAQV